VADVCRQTGTAETTFCLCKKRFGSVSRNAALHAYVRRLAKQEHA
jgi:hypothetical protein